MARLGMNRNSSRRRMYIYCYSIYKKLCILFKSKFFPLLIRFYFPALYTQTPCTLHNFYSHDRNSKYFRLLLLFTKDLSRYISSTTTIITSPPYAMESIFFQFNQNLSACIIIVRTTSEQTNFTHIATKLFPQHCHNRFNFIRACVVRMLTSSSLTSIQVYKCIMYFRMLSTCARSSQHKEHRYSYVLCSMCVGHFIRTTQIVIIDINIIIVIIIL